MKTTCLQVTLIAALGGAAALVDAAAPEDPRVQRGRYLVMTSGCNDCHTPGYMEKDGEVEESAWLTGSPVGFQGPWGTTYPVNLRLYMQATTETRWLERARQPMRPPMPWFNLKAMTDGDLEAIFHYVRALGPVGDPAPPAAPPGIDVTTPYFDFAPKNLPQQARQ